MNTVQATLVKYPRQDLARAAERQGSWEGRRREGDAVGGGILALAANDEPAILVLQMNRQNFSPSLHRQTNSPSLKSERQAT